MHQVSPNTRVSTVNVLGIAGNTPLPYISRSWKRAWQNRGRRCQRRRTFLRKDLTWRVAVARVPRRRKRKRRRRRVKPRGEREKVETEKEREKEEMSFSLKKSCPNKGVLFHAQCTPPQTRSLRYLSLQGARCFSTLLSTPLKFLSFLFETLENGTSFLMGLCLPICEVSAAK